MKLFNLDYEEVQTHIERAGYGLKGLLTCPVCAPYGGHEGCLHHESVYVFNRPKEDWERGLILSVNGEAVNLHSGGDVQTDNPSERRNGVLIGFWCEICQAGLDGQPMLYLAIGQHKGQTEISWFVPKD